MATRASVTIEFSGERHTVPDGITVIQALWSIGRKTVHGVGCLGGVCGACPIGYRLPDEMQQRTGLACQTVVREGLSVTFYPSDPSPKAIYDLPAHPPERTDLFAVYPEVRRCTSCRACSTVCPQEIDVMGGVRAAINGEFGSVAEKFTSCVMCGLCAMVCDVQIRPHRVGIWARRVHAACYPKAAGYLIDRLDEMKKGKFDREWEDVLSVH